MVGELARIETPRFALDDLLHHREFVFIDGIGRDRVEELVRLADLVLVAQRVGEEPGLQGLNRDDPLLPADDDLADRDLAALAQCLADDAVAFLGDAAVRHQVIGRVEIDRVDVIDEFADVDRVGGLEPEPLQIVGLDRDVMPLLVFIPLDDLVALDRAGAGDDELLPNPFAGRLMDHVEADALLHGRRGVEADGDRDERQF